MVYGPITIVTIVLCTCFWIYFISILSLTMKVIAFSWLWNTGKTTVVKTLSNFLKEKWYTVFTFCEVARKINKDNWDQYQDDISLLEIEKAICLIPSVNQRNINDKVVYIFDRTFLDNICYRRFNHQIWKCSYGPRAEIEEIIEKMIPTDLYDKVFLFDTPLKKHWDFREYNHRWLADIFDKEIRQLDNVVGMRNAIENRDEIFSIVNDILNELSY